MQSYATGSPARRRRFAVTVDGVRHEVIVEELDYAPDSAASPAAAPSSGSSPAAASSDSSADVSPDGWIAAPMPGTVTEVEVEAGDDVKAGDVLLILTAMKLENEITAPAAGKVKAVAVSEGDNVNNGDRLVQLDVGGPNR